MILHWFFYVAHLHIYHLNCEIRFIPRKFPYLYEFALAIIKKGLGRKEKK